MNQAAKAKLNDEVQTFELDTPIPKRHQGMGGELEFLATLARIIDANSMIDPAIYKRAPSYELIIPLAMKCFDELGWGDQVEN